MLLDGAIHGGINNMLGDIMFYLFLTIITVVIGGVVIIMYYGCMLNEKGYWKDRYLK